MRRNTPLALVAVLVALAVCVVGAGRLAEANRLTRTDNRESSQRDSDTDDAIIEIQTASPAQRELAGDAVARFRATGLLLPDLTIWFAPDVTACRGHLGLFSPTAQPWRITICSELPFVLSHELAHAWIEANLDAEARQSYTAARGLPSWNEPAYPWNQRAVEDAAFIIQQNLRTTSAPTSSSAWSDRMAAFELLTGRRSPLRPVPASHTVCSYSGFK